jgi:hypothetical protein
LARLNGGYTNGQVSKGFGKLYQTGTTGNIYIVGTPSGSGTNYCGGQFFVKVLDATDDLEKATIVEAFAEGTGQVGNRHEQCKVTDGLILVDGCAPYNPPIQLVLMVASGF